MLKYLVVEISGKQYKVVPNQGFWVDYVGDLKKVECEKVLLKADENKLQVGDPYLKEKVIFDVLEDKRREKIRVAKFHAKSNTRKVTGQKRVFSKLKFSA